MPVELRDSGLHPIQSALVFSDSYSFGARHVAPSHTFGWLHCPEGEHTEEVAVATLSPHWFTVTVGHSATNGKEASAASNVLQRKVCCVAKARLCGDILWKWSGTECVCVCLMPGWEVVYGYMVHMLNVINHPSLCADRRTQRSYHGCPCHCAFPTG